MKTISVLSPARIADRSSILGVNGTHTQTGEYLTLRQEVLRGALYNAGARDLAPIAAGRLNITAGAKTQVIGAQQQLTSGLAWYAICA
jgi:hypothetical protein